MKIKIKKMYPWVNTPKYAKKGDVGMDLEAIDAKRSGSWLFPIYTYNTGIKIGLPKTHFAMLVPRSSLSKKLMWMANHVGIIDSGYNGELIFKFRSIFGIKPYKEGDRIGQILLMRKNKIDWEEVEELQETERGSTGFGSSGK